MLNVIALGALFKIAPLTGEVEVKEFANDGEAMVSEITAPTKIAIGVLTERIDIPSIRLNTLTSLHSVASPKHDF